MWEIVTRLLDRQFSPIPSTEDFLFLHKIQTGSEASPASYSMCIRRFLSDENVVAA